MTRIDISLSETKNRCEFLNCGRPYCLKMLIKWLYQGFLQGFPTSSLGMLLVMSVVGLAMLLLVLLLVFLFARIVARSNSDQDMERMVLDEEEEEDDNEVNQEIESSDQVGGIFIIDDGYEGRCQNSNIRVDKKKVAEKAIYQVQ